MPNEPSMPGIPGGQQQKKPLQRASPEGGLARGEEILVGRVRIKRAGSSE